MHSSQDSPPERTVIGPKKKVAFVCSGGATKAGAFHLGVALALREYGFNFIGGVREPGVNAPPLKPMDISVYVGSSAGSIISSYLASGYSLDNIFNSYLKKSPSPSEREHFRPKVLPRLTYAKMLKIKPKLKEVLPIAKLLGALVRGDVKDLFPLHWLKISGIFSSSGIESYLRNEVLPSNAFGDYVADLFIVATQLNHSRKVVFGKYSFQPPAHDTTVQYNNDVTISDACAASVAIPVIFSPHGIRNRQGHLTYYVDGEIRETLSTHAAVDAGADLVIASYTHQPYHSPNEQDSLTDHGIPAIAVQSLYLLIEQKIKNHVRNRKAQREAIYAVDRYCRTQGVAEHHRQQIQQILQSQLHHRLAVDTLHIHPHPQDAELFFGEHFTLSPDKMASVVKSGFRAAIDTLKKFEFADRPEHLLAARSQVGLSRPVGAESVTPR